MTRPVRRSWPGAVIAAVVLLTGACAEDGAVQDARRSTTTQATTTEATTTEATTTTEPDGSTTTAGAQDPEVAAAVEELSGFVEEQRGRRFLREVPVELLEDDAFVQRLRRDAEEDREEVEQTAGLLRALGLLDADDDLAAAIEDALGAGVIGFYDPETDELVVRGAELSTKVRSTLVHELVHALDDQHFELERPRLDRADDESGFGFSALVEGDAVRVEEAWVDTLSGDEQEVLRDEESADARRFGEIDVPDIVAQLISLPYAVGPDFVGALADEGGEPRVDVAFEEPPTTSEQVLDPAAFLADGEPALAVDEPPADGEVVDRGVIGQAGVLLTLFEPVGTSAAQAAGEGWGGDRYVTWEDGRQTCVRMVFAADSPGDLAELDDAWTRWAEERPSGEVRSAGGLVTVSACA